MVESKAIKMLKDLESWRISSNKYLLLIFAFIYFAPENSFASGNELCPTQFKEYFLNINKYLNEKAESINAKIIFVDETGNVYDCANIGYSASFIKVAKDFHQENASAIKQLSDSSDHFKNLNLCNVAKRRLSNFTMIEVYLPSKELSVDPKWCEEAILRAINVL